MTTIAPKAPSAIKDIPTLSQVTLARNVGVADPYKWSSGELSRAISLLRGKRRRRFYN